ncbi:MAG: TonB-dependent receptor [Pseudomonadota bacterium]
MRTLTRTCAVLCGTSVLALAGPVWAQTAPDEADGGGIREIVVTAQKREQSLNKVGLTVNVLGGDALRERQITSIQDLTAAIPSMSYADTPTSSPIISLRGVGFYDTTLSATPAVSLYMNQVPLAYPIMAGHGIFDLQRVEVLKGPQGILFGQNSTGGAINYVPAAPTSTVTAGISVTAGNYDLISEEGYLSGPMSDNLRVRVAQRITHAGGWQRSLSRPDGPDSRNGKKRAYEGRMLVDFEPVEGVKFELNVNGWLDRGEPQAAQLIGFNVQIPGSGFPGVLNSPLAGRDNRDADWVAGLPKRDNSFWQVSLRGDIAIAGDVTLTSVTAYSKLKQFAQIDFDGTAFPQQLYNPERGKIRSFYQELRLSNGSDNRLRWMIGGNYSDDEVNQESFYQFNVASTSIAFGLNAGGQNKFGVDQTTKSRAAFANAEFDVIPQLTVKGGIRYTNATLTTTNCGWDVTPPYKVGEIFYGAGNYVPLACFPINDLGAAFAGVAPGAPGRFFDEQDEDNVSWKAGLDWKPIDGALIYAHVAKGFKSGGFPSIGASVWSQFLKLEQESVLDYEVGGKFSLFDRRLQVNAAAFWYDYRNKQLRARTIDPVWGNLDVVQNIPKSTVKGAELEITAVPFDGLTMTAAGSYTDGKIDEFSGVNAAGIVADFAGTNMPYSPKWNLSFDGQYKFPVTETTQAFLGGTVTYRSSTISVVGGNTNPPNATPQSITLYGIDPYTLVNLRAGVESEHWRIEVWGKNVLNKYYWNTAYPAFDTITRYSGMPATYGVTVGLKL